MFWADVFAEFEGSTRAASAARYAPHIGALALASWYAARVGRGTMPTWDFGSAAYGIGLVASLLGNHLVVTGAVFGLLWAADRVAGRVRR